MKTPMKTRRASFVLAMLLTAGMAEADFDRHTLVLVQGVEPAIDGAGLGGVYSGAVDAHVDRHTPDQAFYTNHVVRFGLCDGSDSSWQGNGDDCTRGYLRFENFEAYLPPGAKIIGARIILTSAGTDGGASYQSDIGYRTASFGTNITWNTAGKKGDNVVKFGMIGGWGVTWPADNVQTVDVTALVRAWADGSLPNHGIQFTGQEDSYWDGVGHRFYSSDHPTSSRRPRLEIDFAVEGDVTEGSRTYRRTIVITNGPSVFADTYIDSREAFRNENYEGAPGCTLEAWVESVRALFKIFTNNAVLGAVARTGEPLTPGRLILKGASLQLASTQAKQNAEVKMWKVAQDWDPATVTYNKRDSTNDWANQWACNGAGINNVDPVTPVGIAASGEYMSNLTMPFDVTDLLQSYVDGSNNFGVVVGNESWYGFSDDLRFSEETNPIFRPVLVLELWSLRPMGTVWVVR